MYSLKGLYLTVLEPITYKQTERALYIGDTRKVLEKISEKNSVIVKLAGSIANKLRGNLNVSVFRFQLMTSIFQEEV